MILINTPIDGWDSASRVVQTRAPVLARRDGAAVRQYLAGVGEVRGPAHVPPLLRGHEEDARGAQPALAGALDQRVPEPLLLVVTVVRSTCQTLSWTRSY